MSNIGDNVEQKSLEQLLALRLKQAVTLSVQQSSSTETSIALALLAIIKQSADPKAFTQVIEDCIREFSALGEFTGKTALLRSLVECLPE